MHEIVFNTVDRKSQSKLSLFSIVLDTVDLYQEAITKCIGYIQMLCLN